MASKPQKRLTRPVLFICDIQEGFRKAIYQYDKVITTTTKMIRAAEILSIPIYITTQNRARLGLTCSEITSILPKDLVHADVDKLAFSMWTGNFPLTLNTHLSSIASFTDVMTQGKPKAEIVIVGIETHICVTQTALDALREGHKVYVLVDGVSSCNREEIGVALERLRGEGAVVCSSEGWLYECLGSAEVDEFKAIAKLVKEFSGKTKEVLESLVSSKI